MTFFFDTTVLVASMVQSHPHHSRALSVLRPILARAQRGVVAAHGLVETYAVLTTLPVSPRIGPETAAKLLAENVLRSLTIVALTSREYARLVTVLSDRGVHGGAVYDALHVACALKSRADRIYTFNIDDFRRLAGTAADRVVAP